jgi:hypothetical protein
MIHECKNETTIKLHLRLGEQSDEMLNYIDQIWSWTAQNSCKEASSRSRSRSVANNVSV